MTTAIGGGTLASYAQTGWDLSALLEDTSEDRLASAMASLEARIEELESYRPRLDDIDSAELLTLVGLYEQIVEQMTVLGAYGGLWFSADTQGAEPLAFRNRMQHELTLLQNRTLFFTLWWKKLPDDKASALLPDRAEHADALFFLEDVRRLGPFSLDESTEQLINTKDADGIGGLMTLYSMLTNRMKFRLEVEGEQKELTRDELTAYVLSSDAGLREGAYRELGRVLEGEANVLSQIYHHRVRDWHNENVALRGYGSALSVRNMANDIPDDAVDALLDAVEANTGVFHRFFRMKAEWLGSDRLRRYDLYAPLSSSERKVSYEQAVASVLETFSGFDPDFAGSARRVFDDGHIDSEIRPGKSTLR